MTTDELASIRETAHVMGSAANVAALIRKYVVLSGNGTSADVREAARVFAGTLATTLSELFAAERTRLQSIIVRDATAHSTKH